jgi:hypothetical protein
MNEQLLTRLARLRARRSMDLSEVGDDTPDGSSHQDTWIIDPFVDESMMASVDPATHYGQAYLDWRNNPPRDVLAALRDALTVPATDEPAVAPPHDGLEVPASTLAALVTAIGDLLARLPIDPSPRLIITEEPDVEQFAGKYWLATTASSPHRRAVAFGSMPGALEFWVQLIEAPDAVAVARAVADERYAGAGLAWSGTFTEFAPLWDAMLAWVHRGDKPSA